MKRYLSTTVWRGTMHMANMRIFDTEERARAWAEKLKKSPLTGTIVLYELSDDNGARDDEPKKLKL